MKAKIAIIMGSRSDLPIMSETEKMLTEFGINSEVKVLSAHRSPLATINYAVSARARGIRVIIAGAGIPLPPYCNCLSAIIAHCKNWFSCIFIIYIIRNR